MTRCSQDHHWRTIYTQDGLAYRLCLDCDEEQFVLSNVRNPRTGRYEEKPARRFSDELGQPD